MFTEVDREDILKQPMGDWVRIVMDALGELMGEVDASVAEKNSGKTT